MTRTPLPLPFLACFAVVVPMAASHVDGAPMIAAAAMAFGLALFAPWRTAKLSAAQADKASAQMLRVAVGTIDVALVGFVPFALVAIATTKGALVEIIPALAVCAVAASRTWRAAVVFAATAGAAWFAGSTAVALALVAAASLALAGCVPSFTHPAPRLARSAGLGAGVSYVIGLLWHHMVTPVELAGAVAAGVCLAASTSVLSGMRRPLQPQRQAPQLS